MKSGASSGFHCYHWAVCIFVILVAVLVNLKGRKYMNIAYVGRVIADIKYPIGPNLDVVWETPPRPKFVTTTKQPNIVIILADDLGFNDIGFFGGGYGHGVETPNIDSIGRDGVGFGNAYAGHGTCSPSRAALMSGRFPTKFGYEFVPIERLGAKAIANLNEEGIYYDSVSKDIEYKDMCPPPDMVTIPKILKKAEYRTLFLGKWHLGTNMDVRPRQQGFDQSLSSSLISVYRPPSDPLVVNCELGDTLDDFLWASSRYEIRWDNEKDHMNPRGYYTDYLGEEAAKAIAANKNHPFFMYLAFTAPHSPFQSEKSDYDLFPHIEDHCSRVYAGMLVALDRAVGTVLDALKAHGLEDNTLVIFSSDNGAPGYVNQPNLNKPYRGWKATFFEGGIHVPMLMKWPARLVPGLRVDDAVVSHMDIFPTVVAAATGNTALITHEIEGVNLLPMLEHRVTAQSQGQKQEMQQEITGDTATAEEKGESTEEVDKGQKNESADVSTSLHLLTQDHDHQQEARAQSFRRQMFWRSSHYKALRQGFWKIQVSDRPKKVWLHNLQNDPTEKINLAYKDEYIDIQEQMMAHVMMHDFNQSEPIWNSRSESPVLIDQTSSTPFKRDGPEEYVFWAN